MTQDNKSKKTATLYIVWFHQAEPRAAQIAACSHRDAARRFVIRSVAPDPHDGRFEATVVVAKKNSAGPTVIIEVEVSISTLIDAGEQGES